MTIFVNDWMILQKPPWWRFAERIKGVTLALWKDGIQNGKPRRCKATAKNLSNG